MIEYQTENWICLKEFLEQVQLTQMEGCRFLFDLFSALAAGTRNQPVILELEAILVSFKGDRIALLRAPLVLERWMKRSEEIDRFLLVLMEKLPCTQYEIFGLLWKEHLSRASFQETSKAIEALYQSKSKKRRFSRKNQMEPFCLKHPVFPGNHPVAKPESFLGLRRKKEIQKAGLDTNLAGSGNQGEPSWRNQYLQQMEDLPAGQPAYADSGLSDGLSFPDAFSCSPFGQALPQENQEAGFRADIFNGSNSFGKALDRETMGPEQKTSASFCNAFERKASGSALEKGAVNQEEYGFDQTEQKASDQNPGIKRQDSSQLESSETNPFESWQMPQGIEQQMSESGWINQNFSANRINSQSDFNLYGNSDWKQPISFQDQSQAALNADFLSDFHFADQGIYPPDPGYTPETIQTKREVQIQRKPVLPADDLSIQNPNQSTRSTPDEALNLSASRAKKQSDAQTKPLDSSRPNPQTLSDPSLKQHSARLSPSSLELDLPDSSLADDQAHTVLLETLFEPCYLEIKGMKYSLQGLEMVVGRGLDCQIRIHDSSVSSHHAKLIQVDGRWYVQDLKSTNSTWLAGKKVIRRMRLKEGMIVRFGQVQAVFHQ